jgi:hypothetical protein
MQQKHDAGLTAGRRKESPVGNFQGIRRPAAQESCFGGKSRDVEAAGTGR